MEDEREREDEREDERERGEKKKETDCSVRCFILNVAYWNCEKKHFTHSETVSCRKLHDLVIKRYFLQKRWRF